MSNSRFGFRTRTGLVTRIVEGIPAFKLLLDDFPNAAVAYSLRRLRAGYTGACIRVRRSSDNAEQDIGFNSNFDLDTTALLTFVGANNGFITTWYDQSGNGNNATQSTAAQQPRIVNAGVVEVNANGFPAVRFIDANNTVILHYLSVPVFHTNNVAWLGYFSVYQLNNAGSNPYILGATPLDRGFNNLHTATRQVRTGTIRSVNSTGNGAALNTNQLYLRFDLANRTNIQTYLNGSATPTINVADSNTNFNMPTNYWLGNTDRDVVLGDVPISEFIAYNTDQSTNKTAIETNIKTYYGI